MREKVFLILLLVGLLFTTGCTGGSGQIRNLPVLPNGDLANNSDFANYTDDISGLEKYFRDVGAIIGDAVDMSSQMIGAVSGKKYTFKFNNSNVSVEIYDFGSKNTENLSDKAIETQNCVSETGNLSILNKQIPAVLSDSKKYLLIYSDDSEEQKNKERKNNVIDLFRKFKAQ